MNESNKIIRKSATIEMCKVSDADLALINGYALRELMQDEVFAFRVILCGNAVDRVFERFSDAALEDMRGLYIGKTVIKDHARRADGQIARIYATELTAPDASGYRSLIASCYMVRTESNADLIREIEGGIKREGSVSFSPKSYVCSICGQDNMKEYCSHFPGVQYRRDGKDITCIFTLDGVKDCYEFSLVAVPAQPEAGVCKSYKDALKTQPQAEADQKEANPEPEAENTAKNNLARRLLKARLRAAKNRCR